MEIQLQACPGQRWSRDYMLKVVPASIAIVADTTYSTYFVVNVNSSIAWESISYNDPNFSILGQGISPYKTSHAHEKLSAH